jgi:hypothetical protein
MSKAMGPADFESSRDYAMRAIPPAPSRLQHVWLTDWQTAMAKMHYLDLKQATITDSLKCLIRIRASLKKPNLSLELVKPDVENLWRETAGQAQDAAHSFVTTDTGFVFSFLAIVQNSYITGTVSIERYAGH